MSAANQPSIAPEPETSFALDVAFSSTAQPLPDNSKNPILAMGYGFAKLLPGGSWKEGGQKTQTILKNCPFYFCAYDTATDGALPVTRFEIDFRGATPFKGPDPDGRQKNPIVVKEGLTSQPGRSAGCNTVGTLWLIGPYMVANVDDNTEYRCVVTVTVENENSFQIDPEMVVEGGG